MEILASFVLLLGVSLVFGQDDQTKKLFESGKSISHTLLNTTVCITALGNKKVDKPEYMYAGVFFNELYVFNQKWQGPFLNILKIPVAIYQTLVNSPKNPFATYVFFYSEIDLKAPPNNGYMYKWILTPVKNGEPDTYIITEAQLGRPLITRGKGRDQKPGYYVFYGRRFVFVEPSNTTMTDPTAMWKIKKLADGTFIIKNAWSNEYLFRSNLHPEDISQTEDLKEKYVGKLALTWTNKNVVQEAFMDISPC